jgi:hypothetical protein
MKCKIKQTNWKKIKHCRRHTSKCYMEEEIGELEPYEDFMKPLKVCEILNVWLYC